MDEIARERRSNGHFVLIALIAMTFIHCRFFLSLHRDPSKLPIQLDPERINYLSLLGLVSLGLTAAAGAALRLRWNSYLAYKQMASVKLAPFLMFLIPLFFIDSAKNLLTAGVHSTLRWEALPFFGASVVWILILLKLRLTPWVLGLLTAFLCFILFPFRNVLEGLLIVSPGQLMGFYRSPLQLPAMMTFALLLALAGGMLVQRLPSQQRLLRLGSSILVLLAVLSFIQTWRGSASYAAAIWNLPGAMFFDLGEVGGHIWPLVPWVLLPVGGFVWQDFRLQVKSQTWRVLALGLVSAFFLFFLWDLFPAYYLLHDPTRLYSSQIFSTNPQTVLGLLSFYVLLSELIASLSRRMPLRIPYETALFSGGLIYYATHYMVAFWLARLFARSFGNPAISYFAFSLATVALSTGLSLFLILLHQGKIVFFFRKTR